jgi:quercetin dioxygenase-like cupin family protein
MTSLRALLTVAALAAVLPLAAGAATPVILTADTANWQPAPAPFTGAEVATVVGDPQKGGGYYAYLVKMPDGFRIPPHFHAVTENVNVLSGTLMVGLGDTMTPSTMQPLPTGGIASIPEGLHHYAMAKGPTIIEVSGVGPDTTTFVQK